LLEGLVFGTACGQGASDAAERIPDSFTALPLASRFQPETDGLLDVTDITNSLRSLMVRQMGVIREQAGLEEARQDVAFWCRYVLPRTFDNRAGWELQKPPHDRATHDPFRPGTPRIARRPLPRRFSAAR